MLVVEEKPMQSLSRTEHLSELSDGALLAQFLHDRAQEPAAEIVRRYSNLVYSTCRRILGDEAAAEDAAQATFLVLMRKAATLKPTTNLANWLYFAAQHSARAIRRADERRVRREREAVEMAQRSRACTAERVISGEIEAALALLPALQRDAVVLRYLQGLSLRDAARVLDCPEETLHTRVNRALQRLRQTLARRGAVVSSAALIAGLSQDAAETVPSRLTQAIVSACANGARASTAAQTAANSVVQAMLLAKLKLAALLCAMVLAIAVPVGLVVQMAGPSAPPPAADAESDAKSENMTEISLTQAQQKCLDELNGWDKEQLDVFERPEAHPGRKPSGETGGWITSKKDGLKKLGVEVMWNPHTRKYDVVELSVKQKKSLDALNDWDKGELDVFQRPEAHPGRKPSGETGGWVTSKKEELKKLGIEVMWNPHTRKYDVVELSVKQKKSLDTLNAWDKGELDVFERPEAHPDRIPSGETGGWVTSKKEELKELGVEVIWNPNACRYEVSRMTMLDDQKP